jgi:dephospho-CoA kinase
MEILKRPICILLGGKAGVGKSASAEYLKDFLTYNFTVKKDSFAYSLKECAAESFGWDGRKDIKGRKLLQDIGRIGREYNEDIWVSKLLDRYKNIDISNRVHILLVDDFRFPNEYAFLCVKSIFKVYCVKIDAPNKEILRNTTAYNDVSETSLDDFRFDYVVDNSGSFSDLYKSLDSLMNEIIPPNLFRKIGD